MKPRTLTLVIFLVLCASLTAAMPESNEYQESEFFEDFSDYATSAWDYIGVTLEPIVDVLYATAANNTTYTNNFGDTRSVPDTSPAQSMQNYDDQTQFPPQSIASDGLLGYPGPSGMFQPANLGPNMAGPESERTTLPDLTAETLGAFDAQTAPLTDIDMQGWAINSSYLPGYRVEPNISASLGWVESQQQFPNLPTALMHPMLAPAAQLRPLMPAPTRQPVTLPPAPQSDVRPFRCHHDGCDYAGRTDQDLRHHLRYHIPMEERPHGCPYCHQRFLSPREVERHLPTHGLGRRFYCHERTCSYSRRGFGRRDHLRRHVRSQHGAESVQQSSDTNSMIFGETRSV